MSLINFMHLINYKGNKPTTRRVKFGKFTIVVPRGVCVYKPKNGSWTLSLKNLRVIFKDIKVTSRSAREDDHNAFTKAYHEVIEALANSEKYCAANHHAAIRDKSKNIIGSYDIYKKYGITPICGICLCYPRSTTIRVTSRKAIKFGYFGYAYGSIGYDNMTSYVKVGPNTRKDLSRAIYDHIQFKGKQWLDENANAKEFLSKF